MTNRAVPAPSIRRWRPDWPCPAGAVLRVHRRGAGDPTYRIDADGTHWRGVRTAEGTAGMRMRVRPNEGTVEVAAWGSGAGWLLDAVPALLGAEDDLTGFEAGHHPVVAEAARRHPHWRIGRSALMMESLVPAVIEQKVTGKEAFKGFRDLVRRYGEPAPGPRADLFVQPSPATLTEIPSWSWLNLHIEGARSRPIVRAAGRARAIERLADRGSEADAGLRSVPGIGVWTSAEIRSRALGDPDAVSFGDYHIAKDVGWALTGEPVDDAGLARLLEPWRGHRYRVQALLGMSGLHRPRHGARMAPRTHLPTGPAYR